MDLKNNIIKTLKYSAIFNFPLSSKEVYKYLISDKTYTYAQVKQVLEQLHTLHKFSKVKKYYFIDNQCINVAKKRKQLSFNAKEYIKQANLDLKYFSKIPFVKFIGITGSVAAKNAKKKDDVDLFVITTPNFLWLTRLILVIYLKKIKKYKRPYCPNIYLNTKDITWQKKNLYVANEVARLVPLYNKNYTYELFLQKNSWVFEYLANLEYYFPKFHINYKQSLISKVFLPLDFVLYKLQFWFMKRKITTETVNLKFIHFLKNDYTHKILAGL